MNKNGSDMMINVIIVVVLVVIVAVVLIAWFSEGTQTAKAGLSACGTVGGKCVDIGTCGGSDSIGGSVSPIGECQEAEECCLGIKKALA